MHTSNRALTMQSRRPAHGSNACAFCCLTCSQSRSKAAHAALLVAFALYDIARCVSMTIVSSDRKLVIGKYMLMDVQQGAQCRQESSHASFVGAAHSFAPWREHRSQVASAQKKSFRLLHL